MLKIGNFIHEKVTSGPSHFFMCEAFHMKFAPICHQILQVYMYENVTYGPSQVKDTDLLGYDPQQLIPESCNNSHIVTVLHLE